MPVVTICSQTYLMNNAYKNTQQNNYTKEAPDVAGAIAAVLGVMRTMLSSVTTRDDVLATLSLDTVELTPGPAADMADTWPLLPADITPVSAKPLAMPRDRMTFNGTAVCRNNTAL